MTADLHTVRGWWRSANPRDRRLLLTTTVLAVAATLATPALLGLSGYLIARAAQAPPILTLSAAIVGVRFFGVLRAAARYAERLVGHDLALSRLGRERVALFEALTPHVPGHLGGPTSSDVLGGLVADVDRLADLPVRVIAPAASLMIASVACVLVGVVILPAAGGVLAVALLLEAAALAWPAHRGAAADAVARAAAREDLQRELVTTLDAAAELVAWGAAGRQAKRVQDAGMQVDRLAGAAARNASAALATSIAAGAVAVAAVLAVAVPAASNGSIDGVMVAALALLALGATEALGALPDVVIARHEVWTAAARIEALMPTGAAPATDRHEGVGVRVAGVTLARGGRTILDGVDLQIGRGERVALTGPSGCGKSTIADVLLGFARPDWGDVAVCDTVRWAPQDPHVFPTTIAANVRIAAPEADDATIEDALRAVGAGPWLDALPDGLDTRLGEFGERCSGGERQRVGLARVYLGGGDLVILDEPASQLPRDEAIAALSAVMDATPGRAALLVTHRPEELSLTEREVRLPTTGHHRV